MAWGPAGESARPGDPTVPLPLRDTAEPASDRPPYPPAGPAFRRRPGRLRRLLRRLALLIVILVVLAAVAAGLLMAVTPSVGNALQIARAQARAHHAVFPGPPVPARFAASLTATEDHRFYSEPGIDVFAVARVAEGYLTGSGDQGGATLYQQLAKVLYTPGRSGVTVEAEQVALAVKLYLTYTRSQILRMYADVVYFGNGYYGLAAASCGYFGVRPAGLSWPEAALMAGLVQGPSLDDPITHPVAARAREVHVVGRLVATGALTRAQAASALAVPLSSMLARAGTGCAP